MTQLTRRIGMFVFMLFLLPISTLFAQGTRASAQDDSASRAAASDLEQRRALAEQIIRDREQASGREFSPEGRDLLARALEVKQTKMLQDLSFVPGPLNLGDTSADLVYTPVTPCRIIDTRLGGGPIGAGLSRNLFVAGTTNFPAQGGTTGGCGIPLGPATAVLINFVAVNATGSGNLKGSAYPNAIPATGSIVNYASVPGLNIANAVAFPICDTSVSTCSFDITLQANVSQTDVVADVVGYFRALRKNQVESASVTAVIGSGPAVATYPACNAYTGASITVSAPVAGKVRIHGNVQLAYNHTAGNTTEVDVNLSTTTADCGTTVWGLNKNFAYVDGGEPTGQRFPILPVDQVFSVSAGSTTFYVNGWNFGLDPVTYWKAGLVATFEPN